MLLDVILNTLIAIARTANAGFIIQIKLWGHERQW
jgi:hypothetical protein